MRWLVLTSALFLTCSWAACSERVGPPISEDSGRPDATGLDASPDATEDASCASVFVEASLDRGPVDIIWLIDNSGSMAPAIEQVKLGLNQFAERIAASGLDYRVIMLAKRGRGEFDVCIPPPLAGDAACGNGERFFQSSVNVRSVQPLEQFLGTLGQTAGYAEGDSRGGEPWREHLRPSATTSIVVVTDDNSRFGPDQFESFPGGENPFNSSELPPGILDGSWSGLFEGYTFNALYGYGASGRDDDPCVYPDGSSPPSGGSTYTTLVERTGGVRASICDGASAWGPFFDAVAMTVERTARVACDIDLPEPPEGMSLDPMRVNVVIESGGDRVVLRKVADVTACGIGGGWFYDNDAAPTRILLCPQSCEVAQEAGRMDGGVSIQFGCETLLI